MGKRRRTIFSHCIELNEFRYDEETTNQKVAKFRKTLIEREGLYEKAEIERDESGRPM